MLPQELIQMPDDRLIVLRAGLPPVRGRKIRYWREPGLAKRVRPPPRLTPRDLPAAPASADMDPATDASTLDDLAAGLALAGMEPLPPQGAPVEAIEAWVDRFIDASAHLPQEPDHGP